MYNQEQAVSLINCTFADNAMISNRIETQYFNPIEKLVQLHEEKILLNERMLQERDEMTSALKELINK